VSASLERWHDLSTATISDALDRSQIASQCCGIGPLDASFRIVGRAYTIRMAAVAVECGTVGEYIIDDAPPGSVVVIENQGRNDVTDGRASSRRSGYCHPRSLSALVCEH
jgi:4-hydroxy-4-methyl-2-oxoglutarate aldolase